MALGVCNQRTAASRCVARAGARCTGVSAVHRPQESRASRRNVTVQFFKFGKAGLKADDAGIYGSQGREDFNYDDVEQYFNYMGMLATEGTYDRMEALLGSGLHPVDVLLLMAASENDTPKVQEVLAAGAKPTVKDLSGKTPLELASKPEVLRLLQEALAKSS